MSCDYGANIKQFIAYFCFYNIPCYMQETANYIIHPSDWITYIFLGLFFTITATRFLYHDRILHTFSLFLSKRYLISYYTTEVNVIFNSYQAVMFCIQLVGISLLLFFVNETFNLTPSMSGLMGLLEISGLVLVYFFVRFLLGFIVAFILEFKQYHIRLMYEKTNYLSSFALWLLPLLALYVYAFNYNKYFLIGILVFSCLLLISRYLLVVQNNKKLLFSSLFYFILYLCALEIAPLIFILKLSI
jgi:hypothetical protein